MDDRAKRERLQELGAGRAQWPAARGDGCGVPVPSRTRFGWLVVSCPPPSTTRARSSLLAETRKHAALHRAFDPRALPFIHRDDSHVSELKPFVCQHAAPLSASSDRPPPPPPPAAASCQCDAGRTCGLCLRHIHPSECPGPFDALAALPPCTRAFLGAAPGTLCEGDGDCGTDSGATNCGRFHEVYEMQGCTDPRPPRKCAEEPTPRVHCPCPSLPGALPESLL